MTAPTAAAEVEHILAEADAGYISLEHLRLPEAAQTLSSSFHVGLAAQATVGACAAAGLHLYHQRSGAVQKATVRRGAAELECTGYFNLNGEMPNAWAKFSGLYQTADGHVRVHANFDHHRDGVLKLLGLGAAETLEKEDVERAFEGWEAQRFEDAAAEAGLVVARVRTFDEWDAHPHAVWSQGEPLMRVTRIGDAPPRPLGRIEPGDRPLAGLKVLDLTRILAGPICGRTLAAYGADVMLVNGPHLPNIEWILDTSRGKRSVHVDLRTDAGRAALKALTKEARVFVQGYRPGGVAARGFGPEALAEIAPGMVCVSLSAYGWGGPWHSRRGFDSLVQTATGFNHAEGEAFGGKGPRGLPVQMLDYGSGFLMAFGAQAALARQAVEGGSWHVEVSLLQTANWLRGLGRADVGTGTLDLKRALQPFACRHGELLGVPHAAQFERTPAEWARSAGLPGDDAPRW